MGIGPSKQKGSVRRGVSKSPIIKVSSTDTKEEKRRQQRAAKEDWQAATHIATQISHGLRAGIDVRGRLASINLAEREKVYTALCATEPQMVARWPSEASLRDFQHTARQKQAERDEWRARENMLNHILKREGREKYRQEDLDAVFDAPRSILGLEDRADSFQRPKVAWADQRNDYRGVQAVRPNTQVPPPQLVAHASCKIVAPKPTRRMNVAKLEISQYPDRESSTRDPYASRRNPNRRGFD